MLFVHADVAQLVERHLAKVKVAGSRPVVRSGAADDAAELRRIYFERTGREDMLS